MELKDKKAILTIKFVPNASEESKAAVVEAIQTIHYQLTGESMTALQPDVIYFDELKQPDELEED